MENFETIKYKYENGSYDLWKLKNFVKEEMLSQDEFFEITRLIYEKKDPITQ